MNHSLPTRRRALTTIGAGALGVAPFLRGFAARALDKSERPPKRFVFIIRSNGILPPEIQPQGLEDLVNVRGHAETQRKAHEESLRERRLSTGLSALEPFKDKLTVFQGLSGRMCNSSHNAGFGALGCYKSGGETPPMEITVDGLLASRSKSPFPHLGFAMDQIGPQVVYPPLSAAGPHKALPYYADPLTAYRDLFGTVLTNAKLRAAVQVDQNLLDFMTRDVKRVQDALPVHEKEKMGIYLEGFEALRLRSKRLAAMEEALRKAAPSLTEQYQSAIETERLEAHFELAAASLIGGLTEVVSIRAEHLGMRLTGLGLGSKTVHHIGHMIEGKENRAGGGGDPFADGMGEFATRELVLKYHTKLVAQLAAKLQAVPEGDGTMLDNTVILYLSDHGDRHHSKFGEWPMIALGNVGRAFKTGRYLQVPGYQNSGHHTIAHLYLSLLHGAGIKQDTFGVPDLSLPASIKQRGPLTPWMA